MHAANAALTAKTAPPQMPPTLLRRPALEQRLDEVFGKRLAVVVAGAGYGKSTLLAAWAAKVDCAWYSVTAHDGSLGSLVSGVAGAMQCPLPELPPELLAAAIATSDQADELDRAEAVAAMLCEELDRRLEADVALVLDDLQELPRGSPSAHLVAALVRQAPRRLHIVLSSREDPSFPLARLRGRGEVVDVDGALLAFSLGEVRAVLEELLDEVATALAIGLHQLTAGWPAAVRLAAEGLRAVPPEKRQQTLERLRRPEGPLFAYLAEEVFAAEKREVREFLRRASLLEHFSAELCEEVGVRHAGRMLSTLARRSLFVHAEGDGWFSLHALVRDFAGQSWPLPAEEVRSVHLRAGAWLASHDRLEEALRSLEASGDFEALGRFLQERGPALLSGGRVASVIQAADRLPDDLHEPALDQLVGEACQIRGDWDGALAWFERAGAGGGPLPAGIAWRMGLIHYLKGEIEEALAVYGRARADGSDPRDEALLSAWTATACWVRGDVDAAGGHAARALDIASACGDDRALAAAHTVLAMLSSVRGDQAATSAHGARALEHAQKGGDLLQVIRIRANRGSHLADEGAYQEALVELNESIRLADAAGFANFQALGRSNRGETLLHLGELDGALIDLEAAKTLYQRLESRALSYPLGHLGDLHRERGHLATARAAYEEAIVVAERSGDIQSLAPVLAGLARAVAAEDAETAAALVERALSSGAGFGHVRALLAESWIALSAGDRVRAAEAADRVAAAARERRDQAGIAEAIEAAVLSSPSPAAEAGRLEESVAIWEKIGNRIGEARARLALARLRGESATEHERRLHALGVRTVPPLQAGLLAALPAAELPAVSIRSLGGFGVSRGARPVPLSDWQSRKARDLLKILVARRGRATPREVLMETLWPEEDASKAARRLSVALSVLRGVLDPEKRFPPEWFVAASKGVIELALTNLDIDVETFFAETRAGLALRRETRLERALERLTAAEALYGGDFLEEDAYEDWALPLREEARATYVELLGVLAEEAGAASDGEGAVRYLLRVLERDEYNEQAHLGLASMLEQSGRHGEARRAYGTYVARMEEIGVEAAPFPTLTAL